MGDRISTWRLSHHHHLSSFNCFLPYEKNEIRDSDCLFLLFFGWTATYDCLPETLSPPRVPLFADNHRSVPDTCPFRITVRFTSDGHH
ncbi:uncharacterized protein G2W53_036528 [Senna tora]|uniref:Uncharacterized protein n=1 Tax=Senna tora TaxID=362788 RepID=A0A834ST17_9FABA|nr:uncharacterized protein G2W53_036528 [Senna tora]